MTVLKRISDKLSRIDRAIRYRLAAEGSLYLNQGNGDLILMYHNVLAEDRKDLNIRNISSTDLSSTLKYLRDHFSVVPLKEIFTTTSIDKRIAITFDDGLINNLRFALPVLEELQLPATFFITTSWLNGNNILWPDELSLLLLKHNTDVAFEGHIFRKTGFGHYRSVADDMKLEQFLLNEGQPAIDRLLKMLKTITKYEPSQDAAEDLWRVMKGEEIKILSASPLIDIGSHGSTHRNLLQLDAAEIEEELSASKKYLEQVTGKKIETIAYPFGLYHSAMIDMAGSCGYKYQLGVDLRSEDEQDIRLRGRIGLYNDRSVTEQLHLINMSFQ